MISAIGQYEISEHEMNTVYDFASSSSNDKIRYAVISALANQNKNQELIKKQLKTLLPNEAKKRPHELNTAHCIVKSETDVSLRHHPKGVSFKLFFKSGSSTAPVFLSVKL